MNTALRTVIVSGLLATAAASSAVAKDSGQYFETNGLRMYYEVQGKGRPLVLLHGGMVTIETSFAQTRPAFAEAWKTIAIELQAHGHTNDVKGRPLTLEQMATD